MVSFYPEFLAWKFDCAASTFNLDRGDCRRNAWREMTKSTLRQEWHNWQDSRYHCATIQVLEEVWLQDRLG